MMSAICYLPLPSAVCNLRPTHNSLRQEFGWYLADCAGLADYRDGSLDDYTNEMMASTMMSTIGQFEQAVNFVHDRQKMNEHPLHIDSEHRQKCARLEGMG